MIMDLTLTLKDEIRKKQFMQFDLFIITWLGYTREEIEADETKTRRAAYRLFLERTGSDRPASLPTIRRWFGVTAKKEPSREQIFRIALALRLSVPEAEQFLMFGIAEPSWQISDSAEMIAMYCIEKQTGVKKYESMLEEYEKHLDASPEVRYEFNTQWLMKEFKHLRHCTEDEFMCWMWEHSSVFKGYSRTVQGYLEQYGRQVIGYARQDMKKHLDLLLSETGYKAWRMKRRARKNIGEGEWIKRYVRQNLRFSSGKLSEHLGKIILELARQVYSETGQNSRLISELFSVSDPALAATDEEKRKPVSIMTHKRLSDLFHIPEQNEKLLQAKRMLVTLQKEENKASCLEQARRLAREYSRDEIEIETVGEAKEYLQEFIREQKRRRLLVRRTDILPMVLYVAERRYMEEMNLHESSYRRADAVKLFRDMADATLLACNMAPINEAYFFDTILLLCFQEKQMYEYAEVLEAVENI